MQVIEFIKANKIAVAVAVVILVILVYVFYIKPKSTPKTQTKDKFSSGSKEVKKAIPKLGGKKNKKGKPRKVNKTEDSDPESDPEESDSSDEITELAESLHNRVHEDFAKESISLEEFTNVTEGKLSDVVYTELFQLYNQMQDNGDPFKVTYKQYIPIIKEHVAK